MRPDWGRLESRWTAFWNMENHERPLISVTAPSGVARKPLTSPPTLTERWEDAEYVITRARNSFESTLFLGEAFPVLNPDLGPDIVGAFCGCDIEYGENTSWAKHSEGGCAELKPIRFDPANRWFQKIAAITRRAAEDARGDYLVGVTDLHPGTDALVSLCGPEQLCMDLYDEPECVLQCVDDVFEVYWQAFDALCGMIGPVQRGSTNWMGLWHPSARWYVVGSDFAGMIGEKDFERFVIPGLMREIDMLDASIYHLDGPGALRHLDRILDIDKLDGVQWVFGAGKPPARHWIDVYQKIQRAGKRMQVLCEPADVAPICEALRPEGVLLQLGGVRSESEAKDLIAMAERISAKWYPGH